MTLSTLSCGDDPHSGFRSVDENDGVYDLLNALSVEKVEKDEDLRRSSKNVNTRAELEDLRSRSSR